MSIPDEAVEAAAKERVNTILDNLENKIDRDIKSLLSTPSPTPHMATTMAYRDGLERAKQFIIDAREAI